MSEAYQEKRLRRQDSYDLREYDDVVSKNFRELIICARCLGRYMNGGYSQANLNLPPDFIAGEEAVTSRLIDYFLAEGCFLQVGIGIQPILRADWQGVYQPNDIVLIAEQRYGHIPKVGNTTTGFISIEDFCSNLYFDGTVQLIRTSPETNN